MIAVAESVMELFPVPSLGHSVLAPAWVRLPGAPAPHVSPIARPRRWSQARDGAMTDSPYCSRASRARANESPGTLV